ncbi:MAG: hypothetical protein CMP88_02110 [Gammaproteobacteria bacterium]|nr:hypothetical protein [Gammaproteobacteria bacterium]
MTWMAWTQPTAIFFMSIAIGLCLFTILEIIKPTVKRKGFLPISTTRGDRVFIGLLGSAFIHIAVIGLFPSSILYGSATAIMWAIVVLRWG